MDQHIRDILNKYVKSSGLSEGVYTQKIQGFWERHMGPSITSRTTGIRYKEGVVTIFITSSSLRQELFTSRDRIKELINESLGNEVVRQVILK